VSFGIDSGDRKNRINDEVEIRTGVVKGYIDGAPLGFLASTFTGTGTLAQWIYGLFLVTDASKTNSFTGSLDDVRIYNRALSGTGVTALYAALPKKTSGQAPGDSGPANLSAVWPARFLPETAPN
jgi:hypothetical protein